MNSFKYIVFGVRSTGNRVSLTVPKANPLSLSSAHCGRWFGTCSTCGSPKMYGAVVGEHRKCNSGLLLPGNYSKSVAKSVSQSYFIPVSSFSQLSSTSIAERGQRWDLYAGVVVERKPIITQNYDEMQKKYLSMISKLEFELSKKSDHEVRHENDLKMMEKVAKGEIELGNVQTARDDEDKWIAEAKAFEPAKRETEADLKKDLRSLERALYSHLLLLVEQKLGQEYRWICPHSKLQQGETLRQAAERMIRDIFPNMKTKVLGHAPWGFYKYKYPPSEAGSSVGAKVFFYKAQVDSGNTSGTLKNDQVKDFLWLKRDELPSKLLPEYYRKLSECLIDEHHL